MKNRKVVGGVVLAVFVALVVVAVAAGGGDDDPSSTLPERIRIDDDRADSGTSVVRLPGEVTERDPAPATATSTTTEPPVRETTTTTAAPAPVPPAPCAKYDGNEPYFVVCGPVSLKVGEPGLYDLVAQGRIRDDCGSPTVDWGDGDGNVVCMIACESYPEQPRSIERKFQHTYAEPGIFTVRFTLQGCGPDYRPQASVVMEVQVT